MKSYSKTILRMFKHNTTRFLANCFIVVLSLIVSVGLGALAPIMRDVAIHDMDKTQISDMIVKSTSTSGFSDEEVDAVKKLNFVDDVDTYFVNDFSVDDEESSDGVFITRFYAIDLKDRAFNKIELLEGEYPTKFEECVVEVANHNTVEYEIGDKITVTYDAGIMQIPLEFTVTGIVYNPLFMTVGDEPSYVDSDIGIDSVVYIEKETLPTLYQAFIPDTDLMIKFKNNGNFEYFDDSYDDFSAEKSEIILDTLAAFNTENDHEYVSLTLKENFSYTLFESYYDKIVLLSFVLPIFFVLVCALVNSITISRLIADERTLIGCYFSQGIEKKTILNKYMLFTVVSVGLGILIGFPLGYYLLPYVVFPAVKNVIYLSGIIYESGTVLGLIYTAVIFLAAIFITLGVVLNTLKETPCLLLQPKAPKAGKKILLERIKPLWKPLPFRIKSSLRNIFRQKKNFILTLLSIIGTTFLMFFGFSLLDISRKLVNDPLFSEVASSMEPISSFVIIIAILLSILVVYNLANMNIQERSRELATLKVLGYQDIECSFYTFREILFISIFGIILGVPISYVITKYIIYFLDFGTVDYVKWYSYVLTMAITFFSTLIINFILYPKVIKINMNDSLKTLD